MINENVSEEDAAVQMDGSAHCEDRSGWDLSTRIKSETVAEQRGALPQGPLPQV